jgi:hypothetical protein
MLRVTALVALAVLLGGCHETPADFSVFVLVDNATAADAVVKAAITDLGDTDREVRSGGRSTDHADLFADANGHSNVTWTLRNAQHRLRFDWAGHEAEQFVSPCMVQAVQITLSEAGIAITTTARQGVTESTCS